MAFILDPDSPGTGARQSQPAAPAEGRPGAQRGAAAPPEGLIGGGAGAPGAGGEIVKEGDTNSFMADVIDASMQVPVVVDFWAPWCGPCKQLGPLIEKLVRQAGGMVRLVKIDVDKNQQLAAQLRITSIPAVFAFKDGRPVDAFTGALPESQLRAFIERLLGDAQPPLEAAVAEAQARLDAGQAAEAGDLYSQILAQEPGYPPALAGLIRAAMAGGDQEAARGLVEDLDPAIKKDAAVAAAITALELAEQAGLHAGDAAALAARVASNPKDHQARFDLALALLGGGDNEGAIEGLLELFRRDRAWNEEAARKQLLKVFEALGPAHPLVLSGRRKLSSILFS